MTRMHVFIIRAGLGVFFGIIVTRLFFPQASTLFVVGVCVILVAMAYVTESLHGRKKK
ncbi:hypothetical protein [Desulfatitalea alkaliphila]|uniref:Uncharacterized protein n=1 Tax=Desulfatitalea alkaliphila TaxID=2929485 RepID=A0AA41UK12_9BACT|nr:hypothetical protein [Desulfatitalea alkaliphila]MCJ8501809.1 hypothetical protein [Desulfatitalea alkaliphila]